MPSGSTDSMGVNASPAATEEEEALEELEEARSKKEEDHGSYG